MSYLLALACAVVYGAADFLGGLASRRANTIAVVFLSQSVGLLAIAVLLPVLPASVVRAQDLAWGGVAGLAGGTGVALLYRALATATMSVVAPITAVCAAAVPVAAGLVLGARPRALTLVGMLLAFVAIVLVSQSRSPAPDQTAQGATRPAVGSGVSLALASGVAIGLFFLALARTGRDAGLWPLVAARSVSITLFGAAALATATPLRMPKTPAATSVACGLADMLANVLYLLAVRRGELSVVATLASLYPASTVILARLVLGERLTWVQATGVACALVAVVLIVGTAGSS